MEKQEKEWERQLNKINPTFPWSVKNQARMHLINDVSPYSSSIDAISKFPETATALGITLDENDQLILVAPYGVDDLINCVIKPTPYFLSHDNLLHIFEERIKKKALYLVQH